MAKGKKSYYVKLQEEFGKDVFAQLNSAIKGAATLDDARLIWVRKHPEFKCALTTFHKTLEQALDKKDLDQDCTLAKLVEDNRPKRRNKKNQGQGIIPEVKQETVPGVATCTECGTQRNIAGLIRKGRPVFMLKAKQCNRDRCPMGTLAVEATWKGKSFRKIVMPASKYSTPIPVEVFVDKQGKEIPCPFTSE